MDMFNFLAHNVKERKKTTFAENNESIMYDALFNPTLFVYISKLIGIVHVKIPYEVRSLHKGDILFEVESLKIINTVLMEGDGIVEDILVRDGQMVMYDTPLVIIKVQKKENKI